MTIVVSRPSKVKQNPARGGEFHWETTMRIEMTTTSEHLVITGSLEGFRHQEAKLEMGIIPLSVTTMKPALQRPTRTLSFGDPNVHRHKIRLDHQLGQDP